MRIGLVVAIAIGVSVGSSPAEAAWSVTGGNGRPMTACTDSVNKVHQEWPYKTVAARLCLAQGDGGLYASVKLLGDGQILCEGECAIPLEFDGGTFGFRAIRPSDMSSTELGIAEGERLQKHLVGARAPFRMTLTFYRNGTQDLLFDVKGFKPLPLPAAAPPEAPSESGNAPAKHHRHS